MRKILYKDRNIIVFIAHTNSDFEEFNSIVELVNENNKYLTLFIYNRFYSCIEPFNGYPANTNPLNKLRQEYKKFTLTLCNS